jgi:DNA repair protein SbcC/Rad50
MKNLRLRLKGFIGIQKGLGLNEVDIDLSGLSGLVALSGPNGHGKTTILDNLQPYRILPSRKRALIKHVFLRDSEKEFEFLYNGDHYRTLLKIDARSERSEGYIWVNGSDASLVDGKVVNYDAAVKKIFGSQELFVNSVFCAQGSKKLNEMRKGDLQNLFAEFLRLYRYNEWEKTSGTVFTIYMSRVEALAGDLELLKKTIEKEGSLREQIELLESKKLSAKSDLEIAKGGMKDAEDEAKRLEKAIDNNKVLQDNINGLRSSMKKLVNEIEGFRNEGRTESKGLRAEKRDADMEIMSLESVLANAAEIRTAAEKVKELDEKIEILRPKALEAFNDSSSKFTTLQYMERNLEKFNHREEKALNDQKTKIKLLDSHFGATKKLAAGIDARDPECQSTKCSFIVDSLEAAKRLPKLTGEIWTEGEKLLEMEEGIDAMRAEMGDAIKVAQDAHKTADKAHRDTTKELVAAEKALPALKNLASDLPKVEVAASKKEHLEKQAADLAIKIAERDGYWLDIITRKGNEEKEMCDQYLKLANEIVEDVDQKLEAAKKELETIETHINRAINTEIPAIEADLRRAEKDLEDVVGAAIRFNDLTSLKNDYIADATEWSYLKTACGKDGLRSLEIDSVAPVISGHANDLLGSAFGPGYSVKFKTQDEESLKEIFDIIVIDPDGSEALLDEKSGGERVWILKALRLALTLISKEKSGIDFKSAMSDEEDGALDVENAKNFIRLYRSFMAEGSFDDCFFISHKPAAIAMADHVMQFGKGGITID